MPGTRVFAYRCDASGRRWDESDTIQLELSGEDAARYDSVSRTERVGRRTVGTFVLVTDRLTGRRFKLASAPCGLGCHCAAVAAPVQAGPP